MANKRQFMARCAAQAIGVFAIVTTVIFTQSAFAVSLSVLASMTYTGFISGAQFNPSVTLGVAIKKILQKNLDSRYTWELFAYLVVQFLTATLAAIIAWGLGGNVEPFELDQDTSATQGFFIELIWTFLLVGAALSIGNTKDTKLVGGLGVAGAIIMGGESVGRFTGAAMNPAVYFGVNLVSVIKDEGTFEEIHIYLMGELIAGFCGGVVSYIFNLQFEGDGENCIQINSIQDYNGISSKYIEDSKN